MELLLERINGNHSAVWCLPDVFLSFRWHLYKLEVKNELKYIFKFQSVSLTTWNMFLYASVKIFYVESAQRCLHEQHNKDNFWSLWNKKKYMMFCAIWYHFYNIKNVKITDGGVLLLVKLQLLACNFTKSNTPPWVFFTFFKLYKWYQIAQSITYLSREIFLRVIVGFYGIFAVVMKKSGQKYFKKTTKDY